MNFMKLLLFWNVLFATGMQESEINMALITHPQEAMKTNSKTLFVNVCYHKHILCIIMTFLHGQSEENMRKMIANIPSRKVLSKLLDLYSSSIVDQHGYPMNIYTPDRVVFIALSYQEFNQRFLTEVSRHPSAHGNHIENYNGHIESVLLLTSDKKKRNREIFFDFFFRSLYFVCPLFLYVSVEQSLADCTQLSSDHVRINLGHRSLYVHGIVFHIIGAGTWLIVRLSQSLESWDWLDLSHAECFISLCCGICTLYFFVLTMIVLPILSVICFGYSLSELAECGENGPSMVCASVRFPILTAFLAIVFGPTIYIQIEKHVILKKEKNYLKKFKKIAI